MPQLGTATCRAVMAGPSPEKGNEKAAEEAMRAGMVRSRLATILHPENSHAFRVGTCIVQTAHVARSGINLSVTPCPTQNPAGKARLMAYMGTAVFAGTLAYLGYQNWQAQREQTRQHHTLQ